MTENLIINFDDFDGPNEFAFLSNFYRGRRIEIFDDIWETGEHAFQGMKTLDPSERWKIKTGPTPGAAKRLGRRCTLRPDWEEVKYDIMMAVIRAKFRTDREEGERLLDTGDALLVEGTAWGDKVWGVAGRRLTSPGRNWLGTMLMARRAELRSGLDPDTGYHNEKFEAQSARKVGK